MIPCFVHYRGLCAEVGGFQFVELVSSLDITRTILGTRTEINCDHIHRHTTNERHSPAIQQDRRAGAKMPRISVTVARGDDADAAVFIGDMELEWSE